MLPGFSLRKAQMENVKVTGTASTTRCTGQGSRRRVIQSEMGRRLRPLLFRRTILLSPLSSKMSSTE